MIDTNEISKFLTPELCEDAGIIVIEIGEETLDLGAMNLDYIKVKKVIKANNDKKPNSIDSVCIYFFIPLLFFLTI